jgi:3-hydroxy-9,10-secoandrosta-1,3,5(10)-triene-9,17-dione monooxygenase reductase component
MGQFATGVAVITAADATGRPFGGTADAISSLSLDPPLVLASLRRESETLAALRDTGRFAVNVLEAGGRELSDRFAPRDHGVPVLDGALAVLTCRVHEIADGGDHVIVIGEVVGVDHPVEHVEPGPEIALPSALGALRMAPLPQRGSGEISVAVLVGEPRGSTGALLYVHRGCLLGDALGSTTCGGRRRLHAALDRMAHAGGPGVVVYHRDPERGLGACCLGGAAAPTASAAEHATVGDAVRLLELRDPVLLDDELLRLAA